jgi:hypothetical protein
MKQLIREAILDFLKYRNIMGTQTTVDKDKVGLILNDMVNKKYNFESNDGRIAGYIWEDKYIVTEGHHRMAAAMSHGKSSVERLIENGIWTKVDKKPYDMMRFPR